MILRRDMSHSYVVLRQVFEVNSWSLKNEGFIFCMQSISSTSTLEKFRDLNTYKRGDKRAPHKPLLILIAISELTHKNIKLLSFSFVNEKLRNLLKEFSQFNKSYHPEYPFWRLQSDGIWEVKSDKKIKINKSGDVAVNELLKYNAMGGFTEQIRQELLNSKDLIEKIISLILINNFPETYWEDVLYSVGLSLDFNFKNKRDPNFRTEVLRAYEYRCAVCNLNAYIDTSLILLQAAHIRWFQFFGPNNVTNGLALCANHHHLFDKGAFTITDTYNIIISKKLNGNDSLESVLFNYSGKQMLLPRREECYPNIENLKWHQTEVFKGNIQ